MSTRFSTVVPDRASASRRVHSRKTAGTRRTGTLALMEIGILELGASSFRILRAEPHSMGGLLVEVFGPEESAGIDESIDERGAIDRANGSAALAAAESLADTWRRRCPRVELFAIAPDGLGGAPNSSALVRAIEKRSRLSVMTLSSRETGRLAYRAVRSDRRMLGGQCVVAHLGDGVMHLVSGTRATIDLEGSLSFGIGRLHRAFGGHSDGLLAEDAAALFSVVRLSAGPILRRFREFGAPALVVASERAAEVRDVARAWGFLDDHGTLERLALHALATEIINARREDLLAAGVPAKSVPWVAATAVTVDALLDSLGVREVVLSASGPAEGAALDMLDRSVALLAQGAHRTPQVGEWALGTGARRAPLTRPIGSESRGRHLPFTRP